MKNFITIYFMLISSLMFSQTWYIQNSTQPSYQLTYVQDEEWVSLDVDGDLYLKYGIFDSIFWYNKIENSQVDILSIKIENNKIFLLGKYNNEDGYIICLNKDGSLYWSNSYIFPYSIFPKEYFKDIYFNGNKYIVGGSSYDNYLGMMGGSALLMEIDTLGNIIQSYKQLIEDWNDVIYVNDSIRVGYMFNLFNYYTSGLRDIYISKRNNWVKTFNVDFDEIIKEVKVNNNKIFIGIDSSIVVYDLISDISYEVPLNMVFNSINISGENIYILGNYYGQSVVLDLDTNWYGKKITHTFDEDGKISSKIIVNPDIISTLESSCGNQYAVFSTHLEPCPYNTIVYNEEFAVGFQQVINVIIQSTFCFEYMCGISTGEDEYEQNFQSTKEQYKVFDSNGRFLLEGIQQNGEYIRLPDNLHGMFLIKKGDNYWEKRIQI